MKRRKLIHHLKEHGCEPLREGRKQHSIYYNLSNLKTSSVPRHSDVVDIIAKKICKDLEIPPPE